MEPSKTFRPVWDSQVIEAPPRPTIQLPPAEVFIPGPPPVGIFAPRNAPRAPLALPDFKQFAPPDPMGLDAYMHDVQDRSDIMAVLDLLKDQE